MKPWDPSFEAPREKPESAQELFKQAQRLAAEGDDSKAIEFYRTSLMRDPTFLEPARELIKILKRVGREGEARIVQSKLTEME